MRYNCFTVNRISFGIDISLSHSIEISSGEIPVSHSLEIVSGDLYLCHKH